MDLCFRILMILVILNNFIQRQNLVRYLGNCPLFPPRKWFSLCLTCIIYPLLAKLVRSKRPHILGWVVLLSITDHVIFFTESCFCNPFKIDSFILHATIKYLIARIQLKSVITWSEMWQQTAQAKKVYWSHFFSFFSC